MALLRDPAKNFINALSAFWNTFFVDVQDLRAYYDGVQINLGQVYLEILQTILGTSLQNVPLFSKYYFKYVEIPKSRLRYVEGPSPAEDTYAYGPSGYTLASVSSLTNKVLLPTATLSDRLDYYVSDGLIRFRRNLFDVDGQGNTEPLFPVRYVEEVAPATFTEPTGLSWTTAGVKVGDFFRFRILGGAAPTYTQIVGIDGATLYLQIKQPDYQQAFTSRTVKASVVRTPYNETRTGVLLAGQPATTTRFAPTATDGQTLAGTKTVSIAAEPYYRGPWGILTTYTTGDVVEYLGVNYRAKTAHVSAIAFEPSLWLSLVDTYVYVSSAESALNCGLARCTGAVGGVLTLDRTLNFVATLTSRVDLVLCSFAGTYTLGAKPSVLLPQTLIKPGSVYVTAIRAFEVRALALDGTLITLPAGVNVAENVDYVVDYETGELTFLTPWYPPAAPRINYSWWKDVVSNTYVNPTQTLFRFDQRQSVPVLALWGTDLNVDEEALFNNFGYLLDFKRPTSEQYRAFLRGVAQLFLLGPALERFESAMNVMAELPVVQDDDELLLGYDSGVAAAGTDGQLIDFDSGRNGLLVNATATFSSVEADFYPSDVGARLLIQNGDVQDVYVVTQVLSSTSATVTPAPPDMAVLRWTYAHVALTTRFRAASVTFSPDDVNGTILIRNATNARNNGSFKILAVENATTVVLETAYGFDDETNLTWALSRTNQQTVTTLERVYAFPLAAPVRAELKDSANFGYLKLRAFEAMTTAFQVIDYLRDPTWWHSVVIPDDILKLDNETPVRRRVSTNYIEHVYGALDQANYGDFGVAYGVNDEGVQGQLRRGAATWFGANSVQLSFAAGVPLARVRDVNDCLVIRTPGFAGAYPIRAVTNQVSPGSVDHTTLVLERFPPPEAATLVPPVTLDAELPPLLYRRTVAFVMMDRFLKYHAIQIRIDKDVLVPDNFLQDVTRLLLEAKPSQTYIYLESTTDFYDRLRVLEDFVVGYGPYMSEALFGIDNVLRYATTDGVRYGDAFQYVDGTFSLASTPGTTLLPVTLPAGDVQYTLVKLRFDASTSVNGGARRPAEGVDYTVDYANGTITILPGASFDTTPNTVHYVYCVRRIRTDLDPLDPGETRLAYGSTNPRTYRGPTQLPDQMGLVDRAVQITLGP